MSLFTFVGVVAVVRLVIVFSSLFAMMMFTKYILRRRHPSRYCCRCYCFCCWLSRVKSAEREITELPLRDELMLSWLNVLQ